MSEVADDIIFWFVVSTRFIVPLFIPRFPLPAILASLIIDAADQTIFQQFPTLNLEGYQGYDKALDIYYLTIAYISTLRNWTNLFAFRVSRFLFYWRLVGVALFELTQLRFLLLVFPNAFEYFFIFYEAYRLRWHQNQISKKLAIGAAAFIWIVIKLPQEYWIHIAQLDTTDLLKTRLFGVSIDTEWGAIFQASPLLCLGLILLPVVVVILLLWVSNRRLPPAGHPFTLSADRQYPIFSEEKVRDAVNHEARHIFDLALVEKVLLSSLISITFAHVLPNVRATTIQLILGIAAIVVINTGLSHWLARRGFGWAFTLWEFAALVVANSAIFLVYALLRARLDQPVMFVNALFYVLLLSLLITLYDHYRQVYLIRFNPPGHL